MSPGFRPEQSSQITESEWEVLLVVALRASCIYTHHSNVKHISTVLLAHAEQASPFVDILLRIAAGSTVLDGEALRLYLSFTLSSYPCDFHDVIFIFP